MGFSKYLLCSLNSLSEGNGNIFKLSLTVIQEHLSIYYSYKTSKQKWKTHQALHQKKGRAG